MYWIIPSFQVRNFQYLGMSQEKTLDGDRQVKDKGLGMTDECQEHSLDREMNRTLIFSISYLHHIIKLLNKTMGLWRCLLHFHPRSN